MLNHIHNYLFDIILMTQCRYRCRMCPALPGKASSCGEVGWCGVDYLFIIILMTPLRHSYKGGAVIVLPSPLMTPPTPPYNFLPPKQSPLPSLLKTP